MISIQTIYENKSLVYSKDDFSGLIHNLAKQNIHAVDNYDRTILITYEESDLLEKINKAMSKWIHNELTCPMYYLYSILPLNQTSFIIRI